MGKNISGAGFKGSSGKEHFEQRQKEGHYTDLTQAQYESRAIDLMQKEVGGTIDGFETKYGKIVRYDKITHDFVVGKPGEHVSSMFPLRGGQERFEKLKQRDGK